VFKILLLKTSKIQLYLVMTVTMIIVIKFLIITVQLKQKINIFWNKFNGWRGENELLKGEMNSIKISWRKLDVKEDTLKKSLKNSNSARQKEKKKLQNELKVLKESFLAMEKEKDKEILELKQELHHNINQIEVFYKPEMDSISEGGRGGARGAMAPPIFGPASPRKFR